MDSLPRNLAEAAHAEGRQDWLTSVLPAVVGQVRERWSLTIGEPFQPGGQTAWVAPARDGAGADLVLKIAWPHPEAAHEADGLGAWAGSGAVRLHAAHDFGPALALFRELPATADRQVLVATDLHVGNVLAAAREPWLVIDPKPHVGDPAYEPLQHMLNCDDRLRSDPRGLARRMAGLLGLDPDRVLRWLFARCVQESAGCPALAEVARQIAP
jgi:streptomycin 6-kinase